MKRNAVIDIGSNSMRAVVYEVNEENAFLIVDEEKRMARLGSYLVENKLTAIGVELAISTLKGFKALCEKYYVTDIDVVATEAVRRAENRLEFCERVFLETGLKIKVLSGKEEAFYGYLSIKHTIDLKEALLFDIGGSSLEITLVKDSIIDNVISLPLGAIPLTKKFNNVNSSDEKSNLKKFMIDTISEIPWIEKNSGIPIIGIGGAVRTLGKIHKKKTGYPLDIIHNYSILKDDVNKIYDEIQSVDLNQRVKVKGLSKDRADIFAAPLGAMTAIMNYCNSDKMTISEFGIREGVIYHKVLEEAEVDNLEFSLKNICFRNKLDIIHSERVYELSKRIFEKINNDEKLIKLLKTAAIIHEIGKSISVKGRQNHAFYTIINSNIIGLTHKENIMVAYIVAQLWKSEYKLPQEYREIINKEEIINCKKISVVLYLGYMLERYLGEKSDSIIMNSTEEYLEISYDLERSNYVAESITEDRYRVFEEYFNKKLIVKC